MNPVKRTFFIGKNCELFLGYERGVWEDLLRLDGVAGIGEDYGHPKDC
jgi:hypothetical protein